MEAEVVVGTDPTDVRKPFLSHSTWQAYLECPAFFYFQYILKDRQERSAALGLGTAWDEALTTYAQTKMLSHDPTVEEVRAKFSLVFDQEFSGIQMSDSDIWTPKEKEKLLGQYAGEIPGEVRYAACQTEQKFWKDWGLDRIDSYVKKIGPSVKPIHVQRWFCIDFGPAVPFGFKGVIDRVDEDGSIVDNKTSKNRWNAKDVELDLQGVGYAMAYRLLEKKIEKEVRFDVLVKTTTQSFDQQFQQLSTIVQPHRMQLLLAEITATFRNISQGNIYRRPHNFSGRCSYCEYQNKCWNPHEQWARQPSAEEVEYWLSLDPANTLRLESWMEQERQRPRLIDFEKVGAELRALVDINPLVLQFWY